MKKLTQYCNIKLIIMSMNKVIYEDLLFGKKILQKIKTKKYESSSIL